MSRQPGQPGRSSTFLDAPSVPGTPSERKPEPREDLEQEANGVPQVQDQDPFAHPGCMADSIAAAPKVQEAEPDHQPSKSPRRGPQTSEKDVAWSPGRAAFRAQRGSHSGTMTLSVLPPEASWWQTLAERCVLKEGSYFRQGWDVCVGLMLLYTASVFIYRIVFIQFRMSENEEEDATGGDECLYGPEPAHVCESFKVFDHILFWLFVLDFFVNFFFTYRDGHGVEVCNLPKCAVNYLQGQFIFNALACTPNWVVDTLMGWMTTGSAGDDSIGVTALVKLPRLTRLVRLVRLARLAGLSKLVKLKERSKIIKQMMQTRSMRVLGQFVMFMVIIHITACGWYLCAAVHENHKLTWVGRRQAANADGDVTSLLTQPHYVQWCHSLYFVLTVFTTVGFGDMSAVTAGEILYVCFTMLIGAVIHSVVISEVISAVQSKDAAKALVESQASLIDAFCTHVEMPPRHLQGVKEWISVNRKAWMKMNYDRAGMKVLLTAKHLPRALLGKLPELLFKGSLVRSRFLMDASLTVPPRLTLLLALSMNKSTLKKGEVVYELSDFAAGIYIVNYGTFAHVGIPYADGGSDSSVAPNARLSIGLKALKARHEESPGSSPRRSPSGQIAKFMSGISAGGAKRSASLWWGRESSSWWAGDEALHADLKEIERKGPTLYPYHLVGRGSYFGDLEILGESSAPRTSTMRCESEHGGELMMCGREELAEICKEFLKFSRLWRAWAARRGAVRRAMLQRLTEPVTYRDLAARSIQSYAREHLLRRPSEAEPLPEAERPEERAKSGFSRSSSFLIAQRMVLENRGHSPTSSVAEAASSPASADQVKACLLSPPRSRSPSARARPRSGSPSAQARSRLGSEWDRSEVEEVKASMRTLQKQGDGLQADFASMRAEFSLLCKDLKSIVAARHSSATSPRSSAASSC